MLLGGVKGPPEGLNFCNSREGLLMRNELNDGRCSWRTVKGGCSDGGTLVAIPFFFFPGNGKLPSYLCDVL